VRPFWLPPNCGRYLEGWYEAKGSRLYVSRGIGTSLLPIRFLCRPELAVITLGP
jgi:predicted MPP superfamily phosphohydrolase